MGVLDASTSPPKERYAVSKDNIIKLILQETSRYCPSADGSLAKVMKALLLLPASSLACR